MLMKRSIQLLLVFVIIGLLYQYVFKERGVIIFKDQEERYNIIDTQEKDKNIIEEYFAKGMKTIDYISAINYKSHNITKTNQEYIKINYDFEDLLSYLDIEEIIISLNKSQAVEVETIGKSVDNRDIYSVSVGFGSKIILIDANIHASEVAGTMYITKYIIDIINQYEQNNSDVIKLLNEVKIVIIPSVNPDGYEVCLFGVDNIKNKNLYIYRNREDIIFDTYKANANGVDLNRNFPSQHGGLYYMNFTLSETVSNKPSLGYFDYYPGKRLGSEPETKALMYWFNKYIDQSHAYIALHSAGRVIYSGKPNLSEQYNINSLKLANIVNEINDYIAYDKEAEDVGYGNDGTATDYAAELSSGFKFSEITGRLSSDSYLKPTILKETKLGIITLETLEEYTFNLKVIKNEYYNKNLKEVFDSVIKKTRN